MPQVKVRGRGITADATATVIREALGNRVEVTAGGDRQVEVRRSSLVRARVTIAEESGGTVFAVRGLGPPFPLVGLFAIAGNSMGIAKRVADALEQHAGFSDEKV
jgi:hypothetical protein